MAKNGFKILDSDMHVFEPHDLYLEIHGSKMGRSDPARRAQEETWPNQICLRQRQTHQDLGCASACSTTPKPIPGEAAPGEDCGRPSL